MENVSAAQRPWHKVRNSRSPGAGVWCSGWSSVGAVGAGLRGHRGCLYGVEGAPGLFVLPGPLAMRRARVQQSPC